MTDAPERHADKARNLMLNRAVHDLDLTINGHDPEVDVPIKDGVWNKLDKLALQIEVPLQARIAELERALKFIGCSDNAEGKLARKALEKRP